jgi:hypothetical protein
LQKHEKKEETMETMQSRSTPQSIEDLALIDDEWSVTDVVRRAMEGTENPRLRTVMAALVRHLHEFLREVRPTDEEFELGSSSSPRSATPRTPPTMRWCSPPTCWACRHW